MDLEKNKLTEEKAMKHVDVAVVGAGPAGLGAAIEAAKAGASVMLLDENLRPGGQLFKQIHKFFGSKAHYAGTRGFLIGRQLLQEAAGAGVEIRLGTRVWGIFDDGTVTACTETESFRFSAEYIILATGASENSLVFPGNTLPGVMTAGAAQTLININLVRPGKTAVVVGSGNVGLIVSYQLLQAGTEVSTIVEAAPQITGYAVHAGKVRRAGVKLLLSHTVIEARGRTELEEIVVAAVDEHFCPVEGTEKTISTDTLCLAVGLSPRTDLADVTNLAMDFNLSLGGRLPAHNCYMESTNERILVAGDLAGIEEASTALDEGRLAGTRVAQRLGLLPEEAGNRRISDLIDQIASLRRGQFGENRKVGKDLIWSHYERACCRTKTGANR
jgi:NADPH-dependent 2,4-dienoyl-CoA reductase/sulfur reductase-like enzyme